MNDAEKGRECYPVCGPQVKRPLKIRALQYASLILAVAGLVLLYGFATNRDIPLVRIGEITPTMNFATVRVAGEVIRHPSLLPSGGLVFDLTDGSGTIAVLGGRSQAEILKTKGQLPRRGDRVQVIGSLSVNADQEVKLRMQSADPIQLECQHSAATAARCVRLAEVTAARKGEFMTVIGTLQAMDVPGPGSKAPYVLTLEEEGAELAVIFWEDVLQQMNDRLPVPGKRLRACGRVDVYKGMVQLKIGQAADLTVVTEEAP